MTLAVVSGLPGHAKTLFTLAYVEQLRKDSGRSVYYHGIPELTLPWTHLEDGRKWHELPDGSIVVIDEAWKVFPKRGPAAPVPTHVEQLAVHRHRGFDLFLVTQNPALQLDHFARGLVGLHFHVRRVFGGFRSRLFRWEALGNYEDYHSRQLAVASWFKFPRQFYGVYKSAEVHTVKRQLPWRVLVPAALALCALPVLGWYGWHSLERGASTSNSAEVVQDDKKTLVARQDRPSSSLLGGSGPSFRAVDFIPSVPGVPFTAPAWAAGVQVSQAPVISGCGVLKMGHVVTCRCNDQQGNTVDLEKRQCIAYFDRGAFDPGESGRYPDIEPYVPPLAGPADGGADQPAAHKGGGEPPKPSPGA